MIEGLLVSPAEPSSLRSLGTVSSIPETMGVDFLFSSPKFGMVGVQRKEISDLLASIQADNRIARELGQMKKLDIAILLIEGRLRWANQELILSHGRLSLAQYRGMRFSLQSSGLWIDTTDGLADTIEYLLQLSQWTKKKNHDSLITRKNTSKGNWGTRSNRDWGVYFLQGIEGIGPGLAGKIYDRFGLPFEWSVEASDLADIPGIGIEKARKIIEALNDD